MKIGARFKKWAAIYFLVTALPATAAGIWGVSSITWLLQLPADSDNPQGEKTGHLTFMALDIALCVVIVIGLVNLVGYFRQIYQPHTVPRSFWFLSGGYNLVVSAALFVFLWPLAEAPTRLDPSVIAFGLGLITPVIGLVVSVLCANAKTGLP